MISFWLLDYKNTHWSCKGCFVWLITYEKPGVYTYTQLVIITKKCIKWPNGIDIMTYKWKENIQKAESCLFCINLIINLILYKGLGIKGLNSRLTTSLPHK